MQKQHFFPSQKGRKRGRGHWSWVMWEVLKGDKSRRAFRWEEQEQRRTSGKASGGLSDGLGCCVLKVSHQNSELKQPGCKGVVCPSGTKGQG